MRTKSEHCLLELHQAICALAAAVSNYGQDQHDLAEIIIMDRWKELDNLIIETFKPDIRTVPSLPNGTVYVLDHIGKELHEMRNDQETRIQNLQKLVATLTSAGKYLFKELQESDDIMDP